MIRHHSGERRSGIVTLEVLAVLPVMIIFAVSVAEFSMALRVHQRVAFASRFGAKIASEAPRYGAGSLADLNTGTSSDDLKTRIDRWLVSTGLTPALAVRLEHNACGVDGRSQTRLSPQQSLPAGAELPVLPAASGDGNGCFVRVTVWLALDRNLPNALRSFGLDWSGATIRHSTTFRIEADNQPPIPVLDLATQQLPQGFHTQSSVTGSSPAALRITADRHGSFDLDFSARRSHDPETPASKLTYRWSTTGASIGAANSRGFRTRLNLPAGSKRQNVIIQLDVTDDCGCSGSTSLPVEVTRGDDLATP